MAEVTLEEFVRLLALSPPPTAEALERAQLCLDAATDDVYSYLSYNDDNPAPDPLPNRAVAVIYDRAGEYWRYLPFGVLPQGPETLPVFVGQNSWKRHAQKLLPLKTAWGVG